MEGVDLSRQDCRGGRSLRYLVLHPRRSRVPLTLVELSGRYIKFMTIILVIVGFIMLATSLPLPAYAKEASR